MCQQLGQLRQALGAYTATFDAGLLSAADARTALDHAATIEHLAATLKALTAARIAQTGAQPGQRSAAHQVAQATGTTINAARTTLQIGRHLAHQPDIAAAARRGELSTPQLSAITDAAAADPNAAPRLLNHAATTTLSELQDHCTRTKAAAHPDLEARRQHTHQHRQAHSWVDTNGVWHFRADGHPEDGAQLDVALNTRVEALYHHARLTGAHQTRPAHSYDALIQLAMETNNQANHPPPDTNPGPRRGAPIKLLLRVDYDTWLRGVAAPGETCELAGYGPIAVSVVEDLIQTGDAFVAAILTKGQTVAGVAHLGRQPTAHQKSALQWLYPTCAAQGCPTQAHLQTDHRADWAKTHYTALDLLDRLCTHHHNLKTRQNWQLTNGHGKRPFVPPDDPRHPQHQPTPPPPPPPPTPPPP